MTSVAWLTVALVGFPAAAGFALGARRLLVVGLAGAAGGAAVAGLAPVAIGATGLAACGVAWAAAAFAAGWGVRAALARVRIPRERMVGALLGAAPALLLLAVAHAPADAPAAPSDAASPSWLDGPIDVLRAARTLSTLSPDEARRVYDLPEVRAVADDPQLAPLWKEEALLARAREAAGGARLGVALLGRDLRLRAALEDDAFRAKVRRIDLVAVARRVAEWRRERGAEGEAAGNPD